MFLAIINDTYSEVKQEDLKSRIQLGHFFRRQFNVLWEMCPKWHSKCCEKSNQLKMENIEMKKTESKELGLKHMPNEEYSLAESQVPSSTLVP